LLDELPADASAAMVGGHDRRAKERYASVFLESNGAGDRSIVVGNDET
jgi:hypothetical protein